MSPLQIFNETALGLVHLIYMEMSSSAINVMGTKALEGHVRVKFQVKLAIQ